MVALSWICRHSAQFWRAGELLIESFDRPSFFDFNCVNCYSSPFFFYDALFIFLTNFSFALCRIRHRRPRTPRRNLNLPLYSSPSHHSGLQTPQATIPRFGIPSSDLKRKIAGIKKNQMRREGRKINLSFDINESKFRRGFASEQVSEMIDIWSLRKSHDEKH